MAPPNPCEFPPDTLETRPDGVQVSLQEPKSRYKWRVKDCLICSWYQLSDPYSIDEMWRFLRQGRFSDAHQVK
jgi:hypothetical protein